MPLMPLAHHLDELRTHLGTHLNRSPHDYLRDSQKASVKERQSYIEQLVRPLESDVDLRMGRQRGTENFLAILGEILPWDSHFFGYTVGRIDQILLPSVFKMDTLKSALREYAAWAQGRGVRYLFARVDSAEVAAIQGLCLAGYTLIETRHTYYCP